jgi:hypothetical protein
MLAFDSKLVDTTTGANETATIKYQFQDPSGTTGTCTFTVFADLTIASGP